MWWPFKKKKQPESESTASEVYVKVPDAVVVEKPAAKKSPAKRKQVESAELIKPFVVEHEDLPAVSQGRFQEKVRRDGGVKTDDTRRWDKERLRGLLVETDDEKLPTLTVTRKGEFNPIVRATTFDQVARMGQNRDLRKDSFISLYIHNRDVRAPSAFPEEGDSRKEMLKQLEFMITEEQISRDSMRWGGS